MPKIYCENNLVKKYNNLDFKYDASSFIYSRELI